MSDECRTDEYFSDFIRSKFLETLKIGECSEITADGISMFLQSQPYLTSFTFNPTHDLEAVALSSYMGPKGPRRLTYPNLNAIQLTDDDFNFIWTNLGSLKEFHFNCVASPESLEGISEKINICKRNVL